MTHITVPAAFARSRFADPGRRLVALAAALLLAAAIPNEAFALSEIQTGQTPATENATPGQPPMQEVVPPGAVPDTLPGVDPTPEPEEPGAAVPADPGGDDAETGAPSVPNGPVPEVLYDLARLPEPVRRTHEAMVAACKSGDIERLRPLLRTGEDGTQLSLAGIDGDVIEFLKGQSGDGQGHEILAILMEVLDAGFVHVDAGKPEELYVWPYFFGVPLDKLTGPQQVELFKIVTAGDYEDMKTYGAYVFYRVGITPAGEWAFFVAGD